MCPARCGELLFFRLGTITRREQVKHPQRRPPLRKQQGEGTIGNLLEDCRIPVGPFDYIVKAGQSAHRDRFKNIAHQRRFSNASQIIIKTTPEQEKKAPTDAEFLAEWASSTKSS